MQAVPRRVGPFRVKGSAEPGKLQPIVACVGGSWIAPAARVAAADWAGITELARVATGDLTRLRHD